MSNPIKAPKAGYILLPVLIGLSVVGWLFYREFNPGLFSDIHFSWRLVDGLLLAILLMLGRDGGLMWRFRFIIDRELTWRQAFQVNMFYELTSAVTPSAVGGSSLTVLFSNKEGISAGRSIALTISCLFLNELFFVLSCPLVLPSLSFNDLSGNVAILSSGIEILFFLVYGVVTIWTFLLYLVLFRCPEWVKRLLLAIFRLSLLRRWHKAIEMLTDNLVLGSREVSQKSFTFWLKAFRITCLAWILRYLVVNALLIALTTSGSQLLAFVRQPILRAIMAISPTPSGSGVSEYMLHEYYIDFLDVTGMVLVVAFVWRIIVYYMYLLIGATIIPGWVKKLRD